MLRYFMHSDFQPEHSLAVGTVKVKVEDVCPK